MDVVRPGGVVALITSRYTMDKEDSTVRRHLAERATLLGAVRLPNSAFQANAGTEVTTDILFLQKRSAETPPAESWMDLSPVATPDGPLEINEYFARHPEMMLGRMGMESRQYGAVPALIGNLGPGDLGKAVSLLPAAVYKSRESHGPVLRAISEQVPVAGSVKEGGLAERDGQIVRRRGDAFEPLTLPATARARIRGMLQVRDAVREVFRTQLSDAPDEAIVEARRRLNRPYDSFTSRFGPLNRRENARAFAGDPDQPLLLSLEDFDPETRRAAKTAIFDRRTLERYRPVQRVETASEALLVSLNETGEISWPRMESLTGRSAFELQDELGSLVYRNPEGGAWETADRYLSGNVRVKLAAAQAAEPIDPAYRRNVEALQAVQPKDLEPGEIEARLGSSWIPPSDVRDFVAELLDVPRARVKIGHAGIIATWTIELDYGARYVVNNRTTHGTARFRASELIEQSLNGRTPTAYDDHEDGTRTVNQPETIAAREKQQQLKDRFRDWVWEDRERAARLAQKYNSRFNNLRLREFDGSHLSLAGMVRTSLRDGDLAPHQKDAVWRILQGGSPLLAHVVGAGKTWTMTAAAMELRRLDLAKKPMFVVPNHLVDQWGAEFLKLSTANAGGEISFLLASVNAVRDALAGLWATEFTQTEEEREARAGWLLDALYADHLCVRAVAQLPPGDIKDHELVGVSVGSLIAAGLEMRFEGRCTSQGLRDYLYWLYHRILHHTFERDDHVLQSAGAFIRTTLRTLWQGVKEEQKARALRLIQFHLEFLHDELREVVQADAEFSAGLSIGSMPVVQVGPLRFSRKEYLEAALEAVNGRRGRARVWRSTDEVEFESTADGIALKPQTGETISVADPLLTLLSEDASQREGALKSHREWFDCPPDEFARAIISILAAGDPLTRVETAQGWRERSAAVFYANLSRKLPEREWFVPDDIRPPSAEGLLQHYRLFGDPSRGSFLDQIASGSEQIAQEFGVAQSFVRYAGLPVPLPRAFLRCVDALSDPEKRTLVKRLLRTAGSPLSAIHFVRLLAHLADSPTCRYWRLATRAISALLRPDATEQFSAFRNLLQWTDSAFGIWPQTKTWSATERLAMVWAHTHRVFSTFNYLGVQTEWVADRFRRPDFGLCYELFDYLPECSGDIAHPKRVSREAFLLSGLAYAASEKGADWWDIVIRRALLDFVHPAADGEARLNVGLLRDSSLGSDLLSSFLAGDRSRIPCSVLTDAAADVLLPTNVKKLGAEALQAAQAGNSILGWSAIYRVFGDPPVEDGQRELMESAILSIDLAPLADDLDACGILLHSASMQATALHSRSAAEHLSDQAVQIAGMLRKRSRDGRKLTDNERQFLVSLFQVAINLSWSATNGAERASEFARLFARIADAFPEAAGICRHLLNRIWPCEASCSKLLWPPLIRSRAVDL